MIEFKRKIPTQKREGNFDVYINGVQFSYPEIRGHIRDDEDSSYILTFKPGKAFEQFISHKMSEVPPTAEYIDIYFRPNYGFGLEFLDSMDISEIYKKKFNEPGSKREYELISTGTYKISFSLNPDLTEWKKEYTFTDYYRWYSKAVEKLKNHSVKFGMHNPDEGIQTGLFFNLMNSILKYQLLIQLKNT